MPASEKWELLLLISLFATWEHFVGGGEQTEFQFSLDSFV
jgi:hypothetical protein